MSIDSVIRETEALKDGLRIVPSGEIDFSNSPILRTEIMAALKDTSPVRFVIDLSEVEYMDSSGVATLVEAMQHQRKNQRKLVLCALQPKVKSIFEIARLDMVFTIVENAAAAAEV